MDDDILRGPVTAAALNDLVQHHALRTTARTAYRAVPKHLLEAVHTAHGVQVRSAPGQPPISQMAANIHPWGSEVSKKRSRPSGGRSVLNPASKRQHLGPGSSNLEPSGLYQMGQPQSGTAADAGDDASQQHAEDVGLGPYAQAHGMGVSHGQSRELAADTAKAHRIMAAAALRAEEAGGTAEDIDIDKVCIVMCRPYASMQCIHWWLCVGLCGHAYSMTIILCLHIL